MGREGAVVEELMRQVYPHTGKAYLVGITGPPGAGKSTLVDELVRVLRDAGQQQRLDHQQELGHHDADGDGYCTPSESDTTAEPDPE